jgi:branched-chain amino acid transport system ATP-binding protein
LAADLRKVQDVLTVRGVNALYGDSHVLHDVSFSVRRGRALALLGRNGAGKTTCLSTLIGFLRPRDGDIRLNGEPIAGLSPERIARKGIGLVPQGRRIFASLSVRENLSVARRAGVSRGASACEAAKSWSIDDVFEMFPRLRERHALAAGSLSGGEQQMLAIGRALVSNPQLLMLDEPSEGLAPLIVHEVGETLLKLKQQGHSILLVEQNTALALKVADDVAILNIGRIVFDGTAQELNANPELLQANLGVF